MTVRQPHVDVCLHLAFNFKLIYILAFAHIYVGWVVSERHPMTSSTSFASPKKELKQICSSPFIISSFGNIQHSPFPPMPARDEFVCFFDPGAVTKIAHNLCVSCFVSPQNGISIGASRSLSFARWLRKCRVVSWFLFICSFRSNFNPIWKTNKRTYLMNELNIQLNSK